jgi:hypothetical protein
VKWLHVIRVRAATACGTEMLQAVESLTDEARRQHGVEQVSVYAHGQIPGDLAVHLLWQSNEPAVSSPVGKLIADRLRDFGLVDYSTWKQVA